MSMHPRLALPAVPRALIALAVLGALAGPAAPASAGEEAPVPFLRSHTVRGDYAQVLAEVTATLARHNYPVNAVHDYRATFARRFAELGAGTMPFAEYRIVDFCNVQQAIRSLSTDLRMGVFMPCRLAVYQAKGSDEIVLLTTNPRFMAHTLDNPALEAVVERLEAVLDAVFEAVDF